MRKIRFKSFKLISLIITGIFMCSTFSVVATQVDTLEPQIPTRILHYTEQDWQKSKSSSEMDTLFSCVHNPDLIIAENGQDLGSLGSPSQLLFYQPRLSPFSSAGFNLYQPYLLNPDDVSYYRTNKRLTKIAYHMASFREQSIEAFHTQNILKNWNAGIQFLRFDVKDFMVRSDTYYNRFLFFTDYQSQNKRYHLFANFLWNSFNNQLNGGISNDSIIAGKNLSHIDLKGLPVSLSNAGNRYREKSFHIANYFRLNGTNDSSTVRLELQAISTYKSGSLTYYDQFSDTSTFYQNYYYGFNSNDSAGYTDFRNRIGITIKPNHPSSKGFQSALTGFVEHQIFQYNHGDQPFKSENISLGGDFYSSFKNWKLIAAANYLISGSLQGNFKGELNLGYCSDASSAGIKQAIDRSAVPYCYIYFNGNHFQWNNSFSAIHHSRTTAYFQHSTYNISVELFADRMTGFLFMNQNALPAQLLTSLTVNGVIVAKKFNFRKWHLDNRIRFQKVSDSEVCHLPEWSLMHHLYWENKLAKGKFILSAGVRMRYISSFYGDAFMPATGFFYLQQATRSFGVPVFDVITDFKLKLATLFLSAENVKGDQLVMTPHYPVASRIFRFGVRWYFLDQ